MSKMSQEFNLTPRNPATKTLASGLSVNETAANDASLYDPIQPISLNSLEASYARAKDVPDFGGTLSDTNQGAPWLDMNRLCVFVEACNAVRNLGRPCISLRGTGERYSHLALEVVQVRFSRGFSTPVRATD
jgi:hypothetical protein